MQIGKLMHAYKRRLEKTFFGGHAFDEIKMESSPFLRAMQTASWFAKGFGFPVVTINHMFGDILEDTTGEGATANPCSHLVSNTRYHKHFKTHLADGIDYFDEEKQHSNYYSECFPENKEKMRKRAIDFTHEFIRLYGRNNKRTLHFIVTHESPIKAFSRLHGGERA